ncbi:hypothetical protein [Streptomyces sp. NPDC060027]
MHGAVWPADTALSSTTTAHLGIKAVSNTARAMAHRESPPRE